MAIQIKTLQVRVKDRHAALLRQMAFEVNQVFNFINEMTADEYSNVSEYGPKQRVWLTEFDVNKRLNGLCKERGYHINTFVARGISRSHAQARKQFKRSKLRWRESCGAHRSLGWIPFMVGGAQYRNGCIKFAGHNFKVWDSYGLGDYKFHAGNFAEVAGAGINLDEVDMEQVYAYLNANVEYVNDTMDNKIEAALALLNTKVDQRLAELEARIAALESDKK